MVRKRSLTETPNPLTTDIDLASGIGIVRLLRQTDAQIFAGFSTFPGFHDSEIAEAMAEAAKRTARSLAQDPQTLIVLAGAGTSGRLAMFLAREFNTRFEHQLGLRPFKFLIAGGPPALIQAQEGAEDDPRQAQQDLKTIVGSASRVVYVGITCGLSAPYIGGQLEGALEHNSWLSILVGFNPVELARDTPIEGWHTTFKATAERVAAASNGLVLAPVVGPEPITGSTRMKSGTATKVLLELVFSAVEMLLRRQLAPENLRDFFRKNLLVYEQAYRLTYWNADAIGQLIEICGRSLRAKGHIYYLGGRGRAAALPSCVEEIDGGLLGLIDASECPPTFGADFEDVRGFVEDGWRCLFPDGGTDLSDRASHYRISLDDFRDIKLPELSPADACIFLGNAPPFDRLIEEVRRKGVFAASIGWPGATVETDLCIPLEIPRHDILRHAPTEMGIKLVLNAVTTGAHVLAGKVFGNRMVDLRISNNKLFYRTLGIISDLMGVSADEAREALLRSIFQTDHLTDQQRETPVSTCIELAKDVEKVVPKALLLATGKFTYREACEALAKNPIVRSVIGEHVR